MFLKYLIKAVENEIKDKNIFDLWLFCFEAAIYMNAGNMVNRALHAFMGNRVLSKKGKTCCA
jgi:hypothetical protein